MCLDPCLSLLHVSLQGTAAMGSCVSVWKPRDALVLGVSREGNALMGCRAITAPWGCTNPWQLNKNKEGWKLGCLLLCSWIEENRICVTRQWGCRGTPCSGPKMLLLALQGGDGSSGWKEEQKAAADKGIFLCRLFKLVFLFFWNNYFLTSALLPYQIYA